MELKKSGALTKVGEINLIERMSAEGKFGQRELRRILDIYKKYVKDSPLMDVPIFSEVLHNSFGITDDFLMKRIFGAADLNKDKKVDMEEFIRMVGIMLRGSMEEKINFCFMCYDLDYDNELTKEDVTSLLLEAVSEPPTKDSTAEALRDLVELSFSKLDENNDGFVTQEEFTSACLKDWVLMESFGQCLPDHKHRAAFLVLLESEEDVMKESLIE